MATIYRYPAHLVPEEWECSLCFESFKPAASGADPAAKEDVGIHEDLEGGYEVRHPYHLGCVIEFQDKNPHCPICRKPTLKVRDIQSIPNLPSLQPLSNRIVSWVVDQSPHLLLATGALLKKRSWTANGMIAGIFLTLLESLKNTASANQCQEMQNQLQLHIQNLGQQAGQQREYEQALVDYLQKEKIKYSKGAAVDSWKALGILCVGLMTIKHRINS